MRRVKKQPRMGGVENILAAVDDAGAGTASVAHSNKQGAKVIDKDYRPPLFSRGR